MNENSMIVQMTIGDLKSMMTQIIEEVMKQNNDKKPKKEQGDKLMTREQVEKFLGVSDTTLHNWNNNGELPAKKIGRRVYYSKEEIVAKLKSSQTQLKVKGNR